MNPTQMMNYLKSVLAKSRHRYAPLPGQTETTASVARHPHDSSWANRNRRPVKLMLAGMSLAILLYLAIAFVRVARSAHTTRPCDLPGSGFQCSSSISHFWGQYSPYYSATSEISDAIPPGCSVSFAQLLSRHGARYPTLGKSLVYGALMGRIRISVTEYGDDFAWLKNFVYGLSADELTTFGRQQMANSGIKFYARYQHLASKITPFVRSAGQHRVVESAEEWTRGFHMERVADKQGVPDSYPYSILEIPEDDGVNNTLSNGLCTAFNSSAGEAAQKTFRDTFAPSITARLNKGLPGANITDGDTISLMDMCPYTTVADTKGTLTQFCNLFTEDEWHSYDYFQSLGKWYGFGNGSPLGATQGVGFVNELIARLTGKPVQDHTTTNSTLDNSPVTFPLDAVLYADFSHDNDMAGVFAALGLYNATAPLSPTTIEDTTETRGYSASWTVPFGARMYVEKLACSGDSKEWIRVVVNDRVIPLQNCGADSLGRCELGKFVESLGFARSGGNWDQCFA